MTKAGGCTLCGSTDRQWIRWIREQGGLEEWFSLSRCRGCGLVYLYPQPTADQIAVRSATYQAAIEDVLGRVRATRVGRIGLKMIRQTRRPPGKPGEILDIGCAQGQYLAYVASLGWRGAGVELDPVSAQYAAEQLGITVRAGPAEVELGYWPDGSFDVVTLWHVLEHLYDPARVLREVRRVLKPGGTLLLEVPNYASLWSRVFGGLWFALEPPYHRFHYQPDTLERALQAAGFSSVRVTGEASPTEIVWSLQAVLLRLRKAVWDGHYLWKPGLTMALYPLELGLAPFRRSTNIKAIARH